VETPAYQVASKLGLQVILYRDADELAIRLRQKDDGFLALLLNLTDHLPVLLHTIEELQIEKNQIIAVVPSNLELEVDARAIAYRVIQKCEDDLVRCQEYIKNELHTVVLSLFNRLTTNYEDESNFIEQLNTSKAKPSRDQLSREDTEEEYGESTPKWSLQSQLSTAKHENKNPKTIEMRPVHTGSRTGSGRASFQFLSKYDAHNIAREVGLTVNKMGEKVTSDVARQIDDIMHELQATIGGFFTSQVPGDGRQEQGRKDTYDVSNHGHSAMSVDRARAILGEIRQDIYNSPQRLDILLQVIYELDAYFATDDKIRTWLTSPKAALRGEIPLDLIAQDGGQEILEEFWRLAHGVF
jgi:hypothetical protein